MILYQIFNQFTNQHVHFQQYRTGEMEQENVKRANSHLSVCHREKGLRLRVTNVTCCQQNAIKPRGQQPVAVSCRHAAADAQHQKSCRPLGCDDSRVQPRAEITGAVQLQRTAKGTTNVRGSAVQPPQVISRPQPIADVDWNDRGDPQLCAEYVTDIYNHLVHEERKPHYTVRPKFLDEQLGIRAHHRTVLVDWLVLVSDKLQLSNVTLHAMVDLMDRYLQVSAPVFICNLNRFVIADLILTSRLFLFSDAASVEAKATTGWRHLHVARLQVRGNTVPLRARHDLRHRRRIHHQGHSRHGIGYPAGRRVQNEQAGGPGVPTAIL